MAEKGNFRLITEHSGELRGLNLEQLGLAMEIVAEEVVKKKGKPIADTPLTQDE